MCNNTNQNRYKFSVSNPINCEFLFFSTGSLFLIPTSQAEHKIWTKSKGAAAYMYDISFKNISLSLDDPSSL